MSNFHLQPGKDATLCLETATNFEGEPEKKKKEKEKTFVLLILEIKAITRAPSFSPSIILFSQKLPPYKQFRKKPRNQIFGRTLKAKKKR